MDLISTTVIHRTLKPGKAATSERPAVKPVQEVIPANTPFSAENSEAQELIALKAARKATADDPKPLSKAKPVARQKDETVVDDLEAARAEYEEVFGEKPNGKMKAATLRERSAAKRAEDESEDMV